VGTLETLTVIRLAKAAGLSDEAARKLTLAVGREISAALVEMYEAGYVAGFEEAQRLGIGHGGK